MYPIKFEHLYYDKIWGGRDFELFRNDLPDGEIGESWDVACHPNGTGVVQNGRFKGIRFDELIKLKGEELLGTKIDKERFPLLIKFINSNDSLSVQVHPDDEYGKRVEKDMGKTEVWYVVEAFEGANLIVGTKDCTKEQFKASIEKGELDKYLNKVDVKKGDVFFVKSGLVHAIGKGVIIAEIQQNSDTTYRVYDYNRGRELHIEKALDVVDLRLRGDRNRGVKVEKDGYNKTFYCYCKDFSLELYDIYSEAKECSDEERFYIFTCVEGEGIITYSQGEEKIKMGESILIPATMGEYSIKGNIKLLKSYVPNMEKIQNEILNNVKY